MSIAQRPDLRHFWKVSKKQPPVGYKCNSQTNINNPKGNLRINIPIYYAKFCEIFQVTLQMNLKKPA